MRTKFWFGSLKGTDHSEDLGVDRRILLKWILQTWLEDVDCILLALDISW